MNAVSQILNVALAPTDEQVKDIMVAVKKEIDKLGRHERVAIEFARVPTDYTNMEHVIVCATVRPVLDIQSDTITARLRRTDHIKVQI